MHLHKINFIALKSPRSFSAVSSITLLLLMCSLISKRMFLVVRLIKTKVSDDISLDLELNDFEVICECSFDVV